MDAAIEQTCKELEAVATNITSAWGDERTLAEAWGWNTAPLTRHDLAFIFSSLAAKLKGLGDGEVSPELAAALPKIETRLKVFRAQNFPHLYNGNSTGMVGPLALLAAWLRQTLDPFIGWDAVPANSMPANLRRRLRTAEATLTLIEPQITGLQQQLEDIQQAHDAALALPADMQALRAATEEVTSLGNASKVAADAATANRAISDSALAKLKEDIDRASQAMANARSEADSVIERCEQAYSAATTRGLAAAFDDRAGRLNRSMWVCVCGLLGALAAGALFGSQHVANLIDTLRNFQGDSGRITTEIVVSILSLGAPLWFAWLMTKQVGQRFRLAEDYAYKASVAKAYEGYRREATRLDPDFQARLFSTALTRLEEAPLRLVETASHGSPWQELANSELVRRAMDAAPEFKDQVFGLAKSAIDRTKGPKAPEAQPKPLTEKE